MNFPSAALRKEPEVRMVLQLDFGKKGRHRERAGPHEQEDGDYTAIPEARNEVEIEQKNHNGNYERNAGQSAGKVDSREKYANGNGRRNSCVSDSRIQCRSLRYARSVDVRAFPTYEYTLGVGVMWECLLPSGYLETSGRRRDSVPHFLRNC